MDPVLSSLMQTNQVGDDGFHWWIGQVETSPTDDPKKSGRYRVRIIGHNLKDTTPTKELPWAQVMLPVTTPFSDGGVTGATVNLRAGNWVTGFFLDNDRQKPIIMGSIGHTAGATEVKIDLPQNNGEGLGYTTGTDPETKPQAHRSMKNQDGTDPDTSANTDGGEPDAAQAHEENGAPAIIAALRGKHSEANPIGSKACVTIANPTCGTESNFSKQLTNIIGDLLAANQASGGQLGSFYVSQVNGFLYDKVEIGRYHIGRVTRLVRSLVGRIQSEIIKKIREGIELLVKAALGLNVPEEQKEKIPVDPKADFDAVKPKGNVLKNIKKILDKILEALGCAIEDLIDKLVQFLTDLLFDFIMDIFSPAACAVINLVDGIVNEILSLIDGLIGKILGPIQQILSLIGGSVNLVSSAISKVMSFLGINCSGPSSKCAEETVKCNDCGTDEEEDDFLDNLLKDIEEGDTGERFSCDESLDYSDTPPTKVIFVGGVPKWDPPKIPTDGSKPPGNDFPGQNTPPNFFPSTADDPSNDPTIVPQFPPGPDPDEPFFPEGPSTTPDDIIPGDDDIEDIFGADDDDDDDLPRDPDGIRYYIVSANPTLVTEGDTITYTIKTSNVPIGTMLKYRLSGTTIIPEYIVGGSLTGEYAISEIETVTEETVDEEGNLIPVQIPLGIATVEVQIAADDVLTSNYQDMMFTVVDENDQDTPATALVKITYDAYSLVNPNYNPNVALTELVAVESDKELYYEGEDIVYTITSENIPDGTRLDYIMYGDISPDDVVQDNLSGSFIINNNTAKVTVGIVEDLDDERDERAYFKVVGYDATEEITIVGTFVDEPVTEETTRPELDRPRSGDPITDDRGSIITIPIKTVGDGYLEPPKVIVSSGQGFGATAIALLDDKGYVSEIRVTKPGLGYKVNTPEGNGLECIIDSFTLIAPGIKYKTAPTVYIDGKEGIAQAIVDDRGFLISVQILDRTIKYNKTPKIRIIGGGGSGAIVLPNMICLDPEDLAVRGAVKIGTGKYIDCP